jgi:DNA-binding NarL/FixJ family response regulator
MTDAKKAVRIVIADDYEMFRHGLKALFSGHPEFEVVGEAANGSEAINAVAELRPDILLLDLVMPEMGGMQVLRSLARSMNNMRIVLLSGAVEGAEIPRAFELGARGFVMKSTATDTLLECIRTVLAGKYWIGIQSAENLETALEHCRGNVRNGKRENYALTPREMEIIRAVVSGNTNKEIAFQFSISEQTVKHHIRSIFDKLGVYNRLELTLFVFHHGLIEK